MGDNLTALPDSTMAGHVGNHQHRHYNVSFAFSACKFNTLIPVRFSARETAGTFRRFASPQSSFIVSPGIFDVTCRYFLCGQIIRLSNWERVCGCQQTGRQEK